VPTDTSGAGFADAVDSAGEVETQVTDDADAAGDVDGGLD
jgi:hypothetical protein